MKTTQSQAVKAYGTLTALGREAISSRVAFKLFKLKKALSTVYEFYAEQEIKIAEQVGSKVEEDGRLTHPDNECKALYIEKHKELEEMECDIECEKMPMYLNELPRLTIQQIENLEPYIDFKE